ncbi:hypothetical protein F5X96DRAFT_290083 [Biscogniauxia mediterranea]|nr:hypothetical protein F5X96DRAFT_290083 [Biscogniauxia mediterranea]
MEETNLTTTFDYQPSPGQSKLKVLSTITYPTGLSSRCEWGTVGYLDAEGSVQYMPKVNNHHQMDFENMIYSSTSYDRGGYTGGNTYTGAAIGLKMAEVTGTPMDGEGRALSYKYDVTRTSNDNDGNGIARTTTYFNNDRLPIQQIKYSLDDQGRFVEAYQTEYEYDTPIDQGARATAYIFLNRHNNLQQHEPYWGPDTWHCLTRSTDKYNKHSNLVSRASFRDECFWF